MIMDDLPIMLFAFIPGVFLIFAACYLTRSFIKGYKAGIVKIEPHRRYGQTEVRFLRRKENPVEFNSFMLFSAATILFVWVVAIGTCYIPIVIFLL